jgi:hypothetical protein
LLTNLPLEDSWPDWSGETALIIGTGPSASSEDLSFTKGRVRTFVIKSTWRLAPWADALYGLDQGWWVAHQGARKFHGLKFSPSPSVCKVYQNIRQVKLKPFADILIAQKGVIGCGLRTGGGHSGFQAINLAIQFGATRLLLVGFDMTLKHGAHWIKEDRGVGKPDDGRVRSWREAMDACAPQFKALGVEVMNCTPMSALKAYPKTTVREAMA